MTIVIHIRFTRNQTFPARKWRTSNIIMNMYETNWRDAYIFIWLFVRKHEIYCNMKVSLFAWVLRKMPSGHMFSRMHSLKFRDVWPRANLFFRNFEGYSTAFCMFHTHLNEKHVHQWLCTIYGNVEYSIVIIIMINMWWRIDFAELKLLTL
jgi:hypothetical protein